MVSEATPVSSSWFYYSGQSTFSWLLVRVYAVSWRMRPNPCRIPSSRQYSGRTLKVHSTAIAGQKFLGGLEGDRTIGYQVMCSQLQLLCFRGVLSMRHIISHIFSVNQTINPHRRVLPKVLCRQVKQTGVWNTCQFQTNHCQDKSLTFKM